MPDRISGPAPERREVVPAAPSYTSREAGELVTPNALESELPRSGSVAGFVARARAAIRGIIHGHDSRLLVVVGPCSVHDTVAALEYAQWLSPLCDRYADDLQVVMRAYVEKPRTRVGWKGLVNDPFLDGSHRVSDGLRMARRMLLEINELGVPVATEFVNPSTPAWLGDLVTWSAVGARSVESQPHRVMASALECPVGFKNGTSGSVEVAMDAMHTAAARHHWMTVSGSGRVAVVESAGNRDGHLVLRGGRHSNYDAASIRDTVAALGLRRLPARLLVDCGHANGAYSTHGQAAVADDVVRMTAAGEPGVMGVMLESNLVAGRQAFGRPQELAFGQSITDACIGLEDTERILEALAQAHRGAGAVPVAGSVSAT